MHQLVESDAYIAIGHSLESHTQSNHFLTGKLESQKEAVSTMERKAHAP